MSKAIREKMVGIESQKGSVQELGLVRDVFKGLDFEPYTKNRPAIKFFDEELKKEFLVVLSNSMLPAWEAGKITAPQFFNLTVYRTTENADGEPLTDAKGNVIKEMYSMGTKQTKRMKASDMKASIKDDVYVPAGENAFDEYF